MIYLNQKLFLNRKKLHDYLQINKTHLIFIAKKLRNKMSTFAIYVNKKKLKILFNLK